MSTAITLSRRQHWIDEWTQLSIAMMGGSLNIWIIWAYWPVRAYH